MAEHFFENRSNFSINWYIRIFEVADNELDKKISKFVLCSVVIVPKIPRHTETLPMCFRVIFF